MNGDGRPLDRKGSRNLHHQQMQSPPGKNQTSPAGQDADQGAFGQQLANQTPAARANGQPHRDLFLPGCRARQQKPSHVGTGNQQHHADRRQHKNGDGDESFVGWSKCRPRLHHDPVERAFGARLFVGIHLLQSREQSTALRLRLLL